MANAKYRKACENYSFPDIVTHTIRVSLIRTAAGYTPDIDNHEFLPSVTPAARIADGPPMTGKTFIGGRFKADIYNFGILPAGPACDGLLIWRDTGVAATSRLLVWIDTVTGGLPVTPDGVNQVIVYWPATWIFAL